MTPALQPSPRCDPTVWCLYVVYKPSGSCWQAPKNKIRRWLATLCVMWRWSKGGRVVRKPLYTSRLDDPEYIFGNPQRPLDSFFQTHTFRINTFVRIARWTTSVPITYSPHHLLRHSPRSLSKRFFQHESKGTHGDLHYVYEHVNVRTHVKTVHLHRDRSKQMFMQVARRGTSTNV